MKNINILLVGAGNVGKVFLRVVHEKKDFCLKHYRLNLKVTFIFSKKGAFYCPSCENSQEILGKLYPEYFFENSPYWKPGFNYMQALSSVDPGVLVECTPSNIKDGEPALTIIREAMETGWNIVTANKGPLVVDFAGLMEKASKNKVALKISGATGAALPALDVALYSLVGTEIYRAEGILNGTTNYILTRMREGLIYSEALREAQEKGIAESDPSLDVEGWDTASKILLIANAVYGTGLRLQDVKREGITSIPQEIKNESQKKGKNLKLLGKILKNGHEVRLEVALSILDSSHPLYMVNGTEKGMTFYTDNMDFVTVTGGKSDPRGAAAALLKDIINIYREK